MTLWPVISAQSASFFMSLNSPMPKLSSVLRENTGTATPAPLQGSGLKAGAKSFIINDSPFGGISLKKWFSENSQRTGFPVFLSTMTNLNSKGSLTLRVMAHSGKCASSRRWNFFHSPRALPLPARATAWPRLTSGTVTAKVTFPVPFHGVSALSWRKIASRKAEL